jgi:uncharacterized Ntn-hydrolase superfamily protein
MGVAVQSHWFSVGSMVSWAEAGVGAVATQSFVEPAYGPRLLALLAAGVPAPAALAALVEADPQAEVRQVAVVDTAGRAAAHTGGRCIDAAGHLVGDGYSVQANMMVDETVVPAMAAAYPAATGDLAERLLATLAAGQAAGGDVRGQQSAALLVVAAAAPDGRPWEGRTVDLRVEDHPAPVTELRRLLALHRAYRHMNEGDARLEAGDLDGARAEYAAAAALAPEQPEIRYWQAITLAGAGHEPAALPILREVFAAEPRWAMLTQRLCAAGVLPDTEAGRSLAERLVREASRAGRGEGG